MAELEQLAAGHDNTAGLETLREIDATEFRDHSAELLTEWYDSESRRNDSTGFPKQIGKPYVVWVFGVITQAGYQALKAYGRNVTIHVYDKGAALWKDFNAEMIMPRLSPENWLQGRWVNVRISFVNLEEIV